MITQEYLKSILHYDPDSGIWTWKVRKRTRIRIGDQAGTLNQDGYTVIKFDGKIYRSGRLAFFYMTGNWPDNEVDHINTDISDDSWGNLREATSTQNKMNRRVRCDSKLGVKGISLLPGGKYRASIKIEGKYHHLGTFEKLEDAVAARNKVAASVHGDFART